MAKKRSEIETKDTWDAEAIFSCEEEFEACIAEVQSAIDELAACRGQMSKSPQACSDFLDRFFETSQKLERAFTYAHLKHAVQIDDSTHKQRYDRTLGLYHAFSAKLAWVEPELLSLDEETFKGLKDDPLCEKFRFFLEKSYVMKPHVLSAREEEIMALHQMAESHFSKAFQSLTNVDMQFADAQDEEGGKHTMSHGLYALYLQSSDRKLRQSAFESLHGEFKDHAHCLFETLMGSVMSTCVKARIRGFSSSLEASLFGDQIDPQICQTLIDCVGENLEPLHDYVHWRKEKLGYETLHAYDMHVPVLTTQDLGYGYEESCDLVIESVAPLGNAYQDVVIRGLKEERWVDVFENKGKRSGAHSTGCQGTYPYIMLNFTGKLRDVSTLAHEMGHSMHTHLSCANQPYHYSDYTIFLAEIASTMNELLLFDTLLERTQSEEERLILINSKVDDIRSTLFRQTMFAEFEIFMHEKTMRMEPLTSDLLREKYLELNEKYYGKEFTVDPLLTYECLRIPHFFSSHYVFKYATGLACAFAFYNDVKQMGQVENYLGFLSAGSSCYPQDLLEASGIDLRTKSPVKALIDQFARYVEMLKKSS